MLDFLKSIKLYIGLVLFGVLAAGWLVDRHSQYEKGIAYCEQQHNAADAKEIERQKQEQAKAAAEAVAKASEVAEHITSIQVEKPHEIEKTRKLAVAANKPVSCDLSDDELRDFNEAITRSNQ